MAHFGKKEQKGLQQQNTHTARSAPGSGRLPSSEGEGGGGKGLASYGPGPAPPPWALKSASWALETLHR